MRLHRFFTPALLMTMLVLASTPASAGQRERAARGGERSRPEGVQSRGRAVERTAPRENVPLRSETRPQAVVPRGVPRREVVAPRTERPVVVAPRVERRRSYTPHYEPRYEARFDRRHDPRYRSYGYAYPVYRPYFFRPRLHIGFGIWLGYPVPYAYAYPYPVPVYGYAAPVAPVLVGPRSTFYGGVALEISPDDAAVYVDGVYAGIVRDFDGTASPLTMAAGPHRIELDAPGYNRMAIDVTAIAGQVIPYRGEMQPW